MEKTTRHVKPCMLTYCSMTQRSCSTCKFVHFSVITDSPSHNWLSNEWNRDDNLKETGVKQNPYVFACRPVFFSIFLWYGVQATVITVRVCEVGIKWMETATNFSGVLKWYKARFASASFTCSDWHDSSYLILRAENNVIHRGFCRVYIFSSSTVLFMCKSPLMVA